MGAVDPRLGFAGPSISKNSSFLEKLVNPLDLGRFQPETHVRSRRGENDRA